MGIDLKRQGRIKLHRTRKLLSRNIYHRLLVKLYKFLSRRTDSKFNKVVLKRLLNSRVNRTPVSLSRIARYAQKESIKKMEENKQEVIFAVIGTVTDDLRLLEVPQLRICALKFSEKAREKIINAKGKCITFDQLAINRPKGEAVVLLRGSREREAKKHFGPAPGVPGSHAKPYVKSKGRKFERARGKRRSRGFRV
ncbi:MAG: 60S ribosomal protein L18 [archaeon]|nr:60S ribosomal protein L18 [archaeon]